MALPGEATAPVQQKGGLFEDIVDAFINPKALFERNRNSGFVKPALVQMIFLLVVCIATLSLIAPYFEAEMLRGMRQSGQQMPENAAAMMGTMAKVTSIVGMAIAPWFIAILGGLATWIGAKIVGASMGYKQSAMIASWSYMPAAILGTIALAVQGAMAEPGSIRSIGDAQIGPARFVDPETTSPVLFALYQQLDLWNLWGLLLTAIGIMIVARKDLGTGLLGALIRVAIVSLFTIVPALLRG